MTSEADQLAAAMVRCCDAGWVAYPDPCPWHGVTDPMYRRLEESRMAETPGPMECWAIVEDTGDVRRIHAVYLESAHAIVDSGALQPARFVEVVPFPVHRAPQWSSYREPALEQTDEDFDVPLDIPGL